jgi:hypothetical protein
MYLSSLCPLIQGAPDARTSALMRMQTFFEFLRSGEGLAKASPSVHYAFFIRTVFS